MPFRKFHGSKSGEGLFESSPQAPDNRVIAHIDGGARGNPGPSGYGAVLQDPAGQVLARLNDYLGIQTNNFAEYSGLLAVLEYAVKHGHRALEVVSDSELLVRQMRGVYKVNNQTLKQMVAEARELIAKLEWFQVRHVLRAGNREADRLANEAMDRGSGRAPREAQGAARQVSSPATVAEAVREVNGLVVNGRVEFICDSLPEGTMVKIRPIVKR